jgi:prefoldin subunit 5
LGNEICIERDTEQSLEMLYGIHERKYMQLKKRQREKSQQIEAVEENSSKLAQELSKLVKKGAHKKFFFGRHDLTLNILN